MSVHADSKAQNLRRPALAAACLSALVFLTSIACTDANLIGKSSNKGDSSDNEALLNSLIIAADQDGVPTDVKGYTENSSIKIDSKFTTESFLPKGVKDEKAFEFVPPQGYDSEFSQPVPISGTYLAGEATFADCQEQSYHAEEPSFGKILAFMHSKELCSDISFNFCVKLTSTSNPDKYVYLKTPPMDFNLLCAAESLANINFTIDDGSDSTSESKVNLQIIAKPVVTEMYITNSPDCASGGSWESIKSVKEGWTIAPLANIATVYVRLRDILDNETNCLNDTIAHGSPVPTGGSISINSGAAYTTSSSVTLDLAATGATSMYITNTSGCGAGGSWESYATSRSWTLGQTNGTATVYSKYRDAASNESSCINDTIVHTIISAPTSVEVGMMSPYSAHINWNPVSDAVLSSYEVAIGTSAGSSDVYSWTNVGNVNSVLISQLSLSTSTPYYASVRAKAVSSPTSPVTTAKAFTPLPQQAIATGASHACYLTSSNEVKCWGFNDQGELGLEHTAQIGDGIGAMGDALPAVSLGTGRTAIKVVTGKYSQLNLGSGTVGHTCAILDDHTLKCWGYNYSGQLGQGHFNGIGYLPGQLGDALPAVNVGAGRTVYDVSTSADNTCALLDDGTVKCWGLNGSGQLGLGNTSTSYSPGGAVNLGTGRTATAIGCGDLYACALLDNGSIKCWGSNISGQLGQGHTNSLGDAGEMGDSLPAIDLGAGRTALKLAVGSAHTCAVLDNGSVKCWGSNDYPGLGQLGLGTSVTSVGDGPNEMGNNLPAVNLGSGRTALAISAGNRHTCALLDDSTIKCWGDNNNGQLGLGSTLAYTGYLSAQMGDNLISVNLGAGRSALSVSAGISSTCARLDDLTIKCWGFNSWGSLGQEHTRAVGTSSSHLGDNLPAISLGAGRTVSQVSSGYHTCAILDNGDLKCWGANMSGQLGLGNRTAKGDRASDAIAATNLGTGRSALQLSLGYSSTCTLLDNYQVKCWGYNGSGQLGIGSSNSSGYGMTSLNMGDYLPTVLLGSGRTAVQLASGWYNHCALLDNKTVKCWGSNSNGQLGQGNTTERGALASTMGDNLEAIDLGTGRTATQIAAGSSHACAILDNGKVKCWGSNGSGQLGLGHTTTVGNAANQMGDYLPIVDLGPNYRAIYLNSSGGSSTCAILSDRSLKCWGYNNSGQLGIGSTATIGDGANEMGTNLAAVALGTGRTALQIVTGGYQSCALLDNYDLKCWGSNYYGQLGRGNTTSVGGAANQMGDNLPAISLGTGRSVRWVGTGIGSTTCAVLDDDSVKCWGDNRFGQLGQGHTNALGGGANEMGDNLLPIDF